MINKSNLDVADGFRCAQQGKCRRDVSVEGSVEGRGPIEEDQRGDLRM